ncbi:Zn-dependent exopeptidase M28 [bacterium]|nr:Zn-dependent exopeptidase M28 [bacterium]
METATGNGAAAREGTEAPGKANGDARRSASEDQMMADIRALAGIKPHRGPATPGEAEAARYVHGRMEELGLSPKTEPFRLSPYFPAAWALHGLIASAACVLAFWYPLAAAAVIVFTMISFHGDSNTRYYLLRSLFPRRESRHVIGRLPAKGHKIGEPWRGKRVVIAAHLDAGQMGWAIQPHRAEPTARFFKKNFNMAPPLLALIMAAMVLALSGAILYAVFGPGGVTRGVLVAGVLGNLITVAIFGQMEFAGISPGASDNASAVALMLDVARRLKENPTENTEVMFVGVGSEETYMNGMAKFMDDRRALLDKENTYFLVPETLAQGTPRVIVGEAVTAAHYHDSALCGAMLIAARRLGHAGVSPIVLRTGGTDATPPTVRGYKATGLICLNENDYPPNYHYHTDVPENVNAPLLSTCVDIFEETIRIVDRDF